MGCVGLVVYWCVEEVGVSVKKKKPLPAMWREGEEKESVTKIDAQDDVALRRPKKNNRKTQRNYFFR